MGAQWVEIIGGKDKPHSMCGTLHCTRYDITMAVMPHLSSYPPSMLLSVTPFGPPTAPPHWLLNLPTLTSLSSPLLQLRPISPIPNASALLGLTKSYYIFLSDLELALALPPPPPYQRYFTLCGVVVGGGGGLAEDN